MKIFIVRKSYRTQYHKPLILETGDEVIFGEEEKEEKWKGWIWAESEKGKGWAPVQIFEFSPDRTIGKVLENYTAQELDADVGDEVIIKKSLNGWSWAENLRSKKEGWIPDEVFENLEF
ncbi:MAG TPA: hypothetical protein PK536_12875 [Ignavibacteria bacterium]|nr:hypothetical protein [Bacteroidota bacterium]HRI86332.1 hypothetical protein [Ignavibacteria bacterium]HRJ98298.1 hypothetical protein [Ignavibacteria bacterium]